MKKLWGLVAQQCEYIVLSSFLSYDKQLKGGSVLEVSVHYWMDSLIWVWEKQNIMAVEAFVGGGCTFPHDQDTRKE
jgi:hypothetical protein